MHSVYLGGPNDLMIPNRMLRNCTRNLNEHGNPGVGWSEAERGSDLTAWFITSTDTDRQTDRHDALCVSRIDLILEYRIPAPIATHIQPITSRHKEDPANENTDINAIRMCDVSVCDYLARKPGVREGINETKMVHHMKYTLSCRSVCLILHAFRFCLLIQPFLFCVLIHRPENEAVR